MDDVDRETLERRLAAVERALSSEESLDTHDRLESVERRLADLEAAVEAIRGYVGTVRAVNTAVEERADRALRKATVIERHLGELDRERDVDPEGATESVNDADVDELESTTDTEDTGRGIDRLRRVL